MGADAQHRPAGMLGGDAEGVGNAVSGSRTDQLTRNHRMTLDEAHLILNLKRESTLEAVKQVRVLCFLCESNRDADWTGILIAL